MPLTYQKIITRKEVRANPVKLYAFGDNMLRSGYGGQAVAMRDEPNAVGIPTKWTPHIRPHDYFCDDDWTKYALRLAINSEFDVLERALEAGRDVVMPQDGIGTGRAQLAQRAPLIFAYIQARTRLLERFNR